MNGFLELTTSLGLSLAVIVPVDEIRRIDADLRSPGGATITLKNGDTFDCTDSHAYAAIVSKINTLGYTVA